jgi:ATP10 protein
MVKRQSRIAAVMLILACIEAGVAAGQEIAITKGRTFADKDVTLPADVRGKVAILIMGFSKNSSAQTHVWGKQIAEGPGKDAGVVFYQLPMLESVPRMIRGMVTRSIRNDTAPEMKEHMLPVFEKEKEWKSLVKFSAADDAYIVVLDREGKVAWLGSGPWTEEKFATLRTAVAKLVASSGDD